MSKEAQKAKEQAEKKLENFGKQALNDKGDTKAAGAANLQTTVNKESSSDK